MCSSSDCRAPAAIDVVCDSLLNYRFGTLLARPRRNRTLFEGEHLWRPWLTRPLHESSTLDVVGALTASGALTEHAYTALYDFWPRDGIASWTFAAFVDAIRKVVCARRLHRYEDALLLDCVWKHKGAQLEFVLRPDAFQATRLEIAACATARNPRGLFYRLCRRDWPRAFRRLARGLKSSLSYDPRERELAGAIYTLPELSQLLCVCRTMTN